MPVSFTGCDFAIWNEYETEVSRNALGEEYPRCNKVTRCFKMRVPYDQLWFEVLELPKERFVTYEASDVPWLRWAGLVSVKREPITHGSRINLLRLTGNDENGIVQVVRAELKSDEVVVAGIIPEGMNLGGLYVR